MNRRALQLLVIEERPHLAAQLALLLAQLGFGRVDAAAPVSALALLCARRFDALVVGWPSVALQGVLLRSLRCVGRVPLVVVTREVHEEPAACARVASVAGRCTSAELEHALLHVLPRRCDNPMPWRRVAQVVA
jgi:hypothetical protein